MLSSRLYIYTYTRQIDIAKLVLFNSSQYICIGITLPKGEDPVIISLHEYQ